MRATFDAATARDALAVIRKHYGRTSTVLDGDRVELDASGTSVVLRRSDRSTGVLAAFAANVDAPGIVTLDAADVERALPPKTRGWTSVTLDGDRVTFTTGGASSVLRVKTDGDTVPVERVDGLLPFARIADVELDRIAAVLDAAAAGDDARAVLTGVAFTANGNGTGEAAATDTYRLHTATLASVAGEPLTTRIIPARLLRIAVAAADPSIGITVLADDDRVMLHYTSVKGPKASRRSVTYTTTAATVPGPFPNYRALFPSPDDVTATWTVTDAAGTAAALSGMRNRTNMPALLAAAGTAVAATVNVNGTETSAELPLAAAGDPFSIAFNPDYAADAFLAAGDGATVMLRDGLKAALFDGGPVKALLMPMRVA